MKKLYTYLAFIIAISTFAQAPQGFNYQATVRNSSGALIVNQNVNFKFNIMQNSPTAVPIYSETHFVPTDDLGAVNLVIGQGTPTTGTFAGINWGSGNYYMGIELNTGSGFVAMGTTQLLSVPYALYAGSSQNKGKTTIFLTGNITDVEAASKIASEFGPYTENVFIQNTTVLTTVDLSAFTSLIELNIDGNTSLINVNASNLKVIYRYLDITGNKAINSIVFPVLTTIGGYDFDIDNNANLTSINFPLLTNIKDINASFNPRLTSIGISSLTTVGDDYTSIKFNSNALPSSQINTILNKFLTVTPAKGKQISLNGQTPPAPPTGQGIIDKTTLISNGNTVLTD